MKKIAVLDLGTNTFHLLIIGIAENGTQQRICKEKRFVQLAEGGINRIVPVAWKRAINTLAAYHRILEREQVAKTNIYVLATEGMRKAQNSSDFIAEVQQRFGMTIRIISGDIEARLIYYGVKSSVPLPTPPQKVVIMDIGGGSTEFIIADQDQVFWQQSFPLGGAVLQHQFHQHEPIATAEINALCQHLAQTLPPLLKAVQQYPVQQLIGASGTFDTIRDVWLAQQNKDYQGELYYPLPLKAVQQIGTQLYPLTLEQRLCIKGMTPQRAKLMVVAYVLLDFVIDKLNIQAIYQANYAMKEGAVYCTQHHPDLLKMG